PGFRGKAFCGAALVFLLPGVPGGQDALVAGDQQGGGEQHQRGQAHEPAPAAGDVAGGGGFGGGGAAVGGGGGGGGWGRGAAGGESCFCAVLASTSGGTVMVCWAQQAWGCSGGVRISGRPRSRVIEAGRSGQRILPVAAGQATRW